MPSMAGSLGISQYVLRLETDAWNYRLTENDCCQSSHNNRRLNAFVSLPGSLDLAGSAADLSDGCLQVPH